MFKKHDTAAPPGPSDGQLSVDMSKQVVFNAVALGEPLEEGAVLWFSGSAKAAGDLRKIPGLISNENEEVAKIDEKLHDRRLVQAVMARKDPLVGKTVKEVRFRTRYGAAVIAVHREGSRVHEHPGRIKLHAGDVLLLEAGPSFIAKSGENDRENDRYFALLSEVEDPALPRLWLLVPALVLTVAMLTVYTAELTSLLVRISFLL
jgi:TrkA-C domain